MIFKMISEDKSVKLLLLQIYKQHLKKSHINLRNNPYLINYSSPDSITL